MAKNCFFLTKLLSTRGIKIFYFPFRFSHFLCLSIRRHFKSFSNFRMKKLIFACYVPSASTPTSFTSWSSSVSMRFSSKDWATKLNSFTVIFSSPFSLPSRDNSSMYSTSWKHPFQKTKETYLQFPLRWFDPSLLQKITEKILSIISVFVLIILTQRSCF